MNHTATSRPAAIATEQLRNERTVVTERRFPPGSGTGWHTHGHDYGVVPTTGGELLLETPDGEKRVPLVLGQSYTRSIGTLHNAINPTDQEVVFVEIELL